ncbi:hypothetical protein D3C86_1757210 [compost metagenome]
MLVEIRLQGILVYLLEHRRHDEQGEKQRQADQDLVGRRLLQTQGLTQDREDDDDPGETGHQHDEGRNETQRRHDQQDLQADRVLLLAFGVGAQGDRRDRQRIVGGKRPTGKDHGREQGAQQNQQRAQRTHQDLSF